MLPLALLLTATAFDDALPGAATLPGAVRLEVTNTVTVNGGPGVVSNESIETTVAAAGSFQTRIVDGDRTRTFSGTVEPARAPIGPARYLIRFRYRDATIRGSEPSRLVVEKQPSYDVHSLNTSLYAVSFGEPTPCGRGLTRRDDTDTGTVSTKSVVSVTLLAEPTPHQIPGPMLEGPDAEPVPAP
ncbi:hypothetical protein [Alienimonas chondri]|uniref:Uncharacterized protein n=1 Tax=Alienimonas chondri TaxID=2681879 RepID=A0ABX1VCG5_9PLAN|nr:hypothetical protein [Alienimonas chondri]NNJ25458.1 hypothetical protein [Alienimonas chondri]